MPLYTIMPEELIFKEENEEKIEFRQINYNGAELMVKLRGENYEVERILSTNPEDFLKDSIAPGTIIKALPS